MKSHTSAAGGRGCPPMAFEPIAVFLLANDRAVCSQRLQPGRRHATGGPAVRAPVPTALQP
jgi:hypothetical protein